MKTFCQVIILLTFASTTLVAQRQKNTTKKTSSFTNPSLMVGANLLWPGGSYGSNLTGQGVNIALWEAGNDFNANTIGFNGRLTNQESSGLSLHATHVARLLALNTDSGIAYNSTISVFGLGNSISNWAAEMGSEANLKLFIANLSYANGGGWTSTTDTNWYGVDNISLEEDYKFGFYDKEARTLDSLVNTYPYFLPIKAVGNSKGLALLDTSSNFYAWHYDNTSSTWTQVKYSSHFPKANGSGGYDCLPGNSTGKNYLVVGSCTDIGSRYSAVGEVTLSTLSSTGPTDDGRIKPDIVAPTSGGLTSYAAPVVSGSIALLQEHHYTKKGTFLNTTSVRGILCHTASEAGANDGPDYQMGWGLLNVEAAIEFLDGSKNQLIETSLDPSDSIVISFYSDGLTPTKVSLVWNDPKGESPTLTYSPSDLDNSSSILVNDLDLRIHSTTNHSITYQPWVLDPSNPSNAAIKGDNSRDNIEVVDAGILSAGWYKIKVTHKGTINATQDLSLLAEGITTVVFENNAWSLSPASWTGKEWVVIKDPVNTATLSGSFTVGRMDVNPKAKLEVSSGTLTVGNCLFIHADSTGYGQYVGSISGVVKDDFFFDGTNDYRHFTTPIQTNFQKWLMDDLTRTLDQNASTPSVWSFDNATASWSAIDLSDLAAMVPIALFSGSNSGYEFSKLPLCIDASGDYTYQNHILTLTTDDDSDGSISDLGWNLVGNPFTANLNWASVISANSGVTNGSFYIWDSENQQYATSNGTVHTLNANGIIAKNQAFFTYLPNTSGTTLNLNTTATTTDSTALLKTSPKHLLITANYRGRKDQVIIVFDKEAHQEYVVGEDALKKIYDSEFYLSTQPENTFQTLSIDVRPENRDCTIPLKFGSPLETITLKMEFFGDFNQSIYLTDGQLEEPIYENLSYNLSNFNLENTKIEIRNTLSKVRPQDQTIWYAKGKIFFPNHHLSEVTLFNSNGRVVMKKKGPSSPIDISAFPTGIYLMKISNGNPQKINHIR